MTDTYVAPLRPVPGLHGLRDRLPLGRAVRQADRGDARADRAPATRAAGRPAVPARCSSRSSPIPTGCALLALPLWLYQAIGRCAPWCSRSGRAGLPAAAAAGDGGAAAAAVARRPCARVARRASRRGARARRRVGLLLGCVQRVFFGDVNAATARVLAAEGCEVVVPPEQGCCGALLSTPGGRRTRWTWPGALSTPSRRRRWTPS